MGEILDELQLLGVQEVGPEPSYRVFQKQKDHRRGCQALRKHFENPRRFNLKKNYRTANAANNLRGFERMTMDEKTRTYLRQVEEARKTLQKTLSERQKVRELLKEKPRKLMMTF